MRSDFKSARTDLQSDYCRLILCSVGFAIRQVRVSRICNPLYAMLSFFRIKNADTQCGRISNPPERNPLLCLFLLYNLPITCLVTSFSGDNAKVTELL